jgi:hypothetical protein
VVLFNTGWLELIGKDDKQFLEVEPGIGMEAAKWLADQGIVAFGGDTQASEVYPNPNGAEEFPINQYMLAKRGIYNLELIDSRAAWCATRPGNSCSYSASRCTSVRPRSTSTRWRSDEHCPRLAVVRRPPLPRQL